MKVGDKRKRKESFGARRTRIITICRVSRLAKIPEERALGIRVDCAGQGHRCPDNEKRHVLPAFLLIH